MRCAPQLHGRRKSGKRFEAGVDEGSEANKILAKIAPNDYRVVETIAAVISIPLVREE